MSTALTDIQGLRSPDQEALAWLGQQHDAMVALLADVVNIDCGSYNKPGVDAVCARFARFFAEHDIAATEAMARMRRSC
jgi:glutamate carboxypeptidase